MKKIGIVSCYFKNNYGSMLQAYATKKFLDNYGIANETISIDYNQDFKKGKRKFYIEQVTNFNFVKSKFGMIKLKFDIKFNKELRKNTSIRTKKYNEFKREFNLSKACTTYDDLSKMAKERYSDVIVGSDQLWLPVNAVADYYTLNWVPNEINKVSYATSFGVSNVPYKYKEKYKNFLNRIEHLSVRENDGVSIIKEITGKEAKIVVDPTLLLTKEEWEEIAIKGRIIKEKYILCYFLGSNIEHRKFAEKIREKTGYEIVSLNHADEYVKYSDIYADITPYDIGPREWINLVKNAEFVCTDSFHCTVFSIMFNKNFYVFRRHKSKNKNSTNSRLDSLFSITGISNERILSCEEDVNEILNYEIDYEKVNGKIEKFRKDSQEWLLNSIKWKDDDVKHINITSKEDCCGCTACYAVCPLNAITMEKDNEGFLYPKIDESKCTNCGLCKKTCPIINKHFFPNYEQKAYLFQNKDENIRKESTSGGFFTAIGNYVIDNGGIVYGASFDNNFIVNHTKATNKDDLAKFRKSKYVQSSQNDCFKEIKKYLEENKYVCYSGTPCQVAGLKSYLNKEYEKLALVDIMCHSVPSPLFFEKYKEYILKKMKASKIINIDFRDKCKYGYKYPMMTVVTDNGTYSQGIDTDPYLRAFFGDISVRPSCYNCQFKTQKRVSDITIWDCFNINEIDKSFDDDIGTTRILIHSRKGQKIIDKLNDNRLKEVDMNIAIRKVREMTNSVNYNNIREKFFCDIENTDAINIFFPVNTKTMINSLTRKALSKIGIYSFLKTITKRMIGR